MAIQEFYGTISELNFITHLGTGKYRPNHEPRSVLLEKYIISALNRKTWGSISRSECIDFAEKCLRNNTT